MKVKEKKSRTKQQKETLKFFDDKAKEWEDKATGKMEWKVNVIKQRNDYALKVMEGRKKTKYVLDVGSGVGDLVCEMAKRGVRATGIDIAGGMVDLAHRRASDERLDLAEFITTDYFDWHVDDESYDMIVANGFIEYISYEQRDDFFKDVWRVLKPGGSLVVSSRNRLFNLKSANDYTRGELRGGQVEKLLREEIAIVSSESIDELRRVRAAELQPENTRHSNTGIGVNTRYQYTPVQLLKLLEKIGYQAKDISPIHIHVGSPMFKEENKAVHYKMANQMQKYALSNRQLIPQASAFMVHAMKQ